MKVQKLDENQFYFDCPGCECSHYIDPHIWTFNGDFENPTVSPSILVRGTEDLTDEQCERIMAGEKFKPKPFVCHSFVQNGQIQFLDDCTHKLAGQTVELPEIL